MTLDFDEIYRTFTEPDGSILGPWVRDPRLGLIPEAESAKVEAASCLWVVKNAGPRFRMLSLGAAPGDWIIRTERAFRKLHPDGDYASIGVEADLNKVLMIQAWLAEHNCSLKDNAILFGSVTPLDGWSYFPLIEDDDWGASVVRFSKDFDELKSEPAIAGVTRPNLRVIRAFSLNSLLRMMGTTDFLHCDIQGGENVIFPSAMDEMNARVRVCCISIHATAYDRNLKLLFAEHGWQTVAAADGVYKYPPEGEECHLDGQIVFLNPRLPFGA